MALPEIGIIALPGTTASRETVREFSRAGEKAILMDRPGDHLLDGYVIAAGFSYGDCLRPGAIAARTGIMEEVKRAALEGRPILGICNGFQILTEAGILPGALLVNSSARFVSRRVTCIIEAERGYLAPLSGERMTLPIAHRAGRYVSSGEFQVVMRYEGEDPNGSEDRIAGISNREGNVVGMMPHPERAADPILGMKDGRRIIEAFIRAASR